MKLNKKWIKIMVASMAFYGCSDMNSSLEPYLQSGETIYVRQVDSVKIFPGENRVKITYWNYDPKVAKLTVYWDFRQGSASFDVPADRLGEEVEIIVENLAEKQFTFELITSNREGKYPSIPLSISEKVYGTRYAASLTNRKIKEAIVNPFAHNRIEITWVDPLETMAGAELMYRNSSNTEVILKVSNDDTNTYITDIHDENNEIRYRTLYVPENCIDTFFTAYFPISLTLSEGVEEQLDRLKFSRWNPSGIPYEALNGWDIEKLWDGFIPAIHSEGTVGFGSPAGISLPWSFTFDMGQVSMLRHVRLYPRIHGQQYTQSHPKRIEIWGSPTPDVTADFADWVFLGEFNSIKPSGSGAGVVTGEDTEYAGVGEYFTLTDNTDVPVRYLRFHTTETWVMPPQLVILMEVELFGVIQK